MGERRQLINLAYRLLGSLAEAEDAVQETYARWYAMSRQQQEAMRDADCDGAGDLRCRGEVRGIGSERCLEACPGLRCRSG